MRLINSSLLETCILGRATIPFDERRMAGNFENSFSLRSTILILFSKERERKEKRKKRRKEILWGCSQRFGGGGGWFRLTRFFILHLALLLSAIGNKERDQMMAVPSFEFVMKEEEGRGWINPWLSKRCPFLLLLLLEQFSIDRSCFVVYVQWSLIFFVNQ